MIIRRLIKTDGTHMDYVTIFVKLSRKAKQSSSLYFTNLKKKNRKIWKIEKLRKKKVEIMEEKLSPIRMTLTAVVLVL